MGYLLLWSLLPMSPGASPSPLVMVIQRLGWQHFGSPVRESQAEDLRRGLTLLGEQRWTSAWWRSFGELPPGAGEPGRWIYPHRGLIFEEE